MTLIADLRVTTNIASAGLTGTGALTATTAADIPISAALTGTGALSASVVLNVPITAAITGSGDLRADLVMVIPINAALTGAGDLRASFETPIDAALTGTGALTASLVVVTNVAAALTGTGALSGTIGSEVNIEAALSGTGTLSASVEGATGAVAETPTTPLPRGMTTWDFSSAGAWIPAHPFALKPYLPPVVSLGQVWFKAYASFTAEIEVVPLVVVAPRAAFALGAAFRVQMVQLVVEVRGATFGGGRELPPATFTADREVVSGRSGGQKMYDAVEDLILSGALPPELALLEGLREVLR